MERLANALEAWMELKSPLVGSVGSVQVAEGRVTVAQGSYGTEVPGIQQQGGPAI